jgi:ubiquinone/menaquinone biosynthesis C-methylase UbiE
VFHFKTRERFLHEAFRVLRPGGYLLLTDILLSEWGSHHDLWWIEKSNQALTDLAEYRSLYRRIGYENILIEDATAACWEGHYKHLAAFSQQQLLAGALAVETYNEIAARVFRILPFIGCYLLVAARKPASVD